MLSSREFGTWKRLNSDKIKNQMIKVIFSFLQIEADLMDNKDLEEGEFTTGEIKEVRSSLLKKISKGIEEIASEIKENIGNFFFDS